jgi:hypothetical protein
MSNLMVLFGLLLGVPGAVVAVDAAADWRRWRHVAASRLNVFRRLRELEERLAVLENSWRLTPDEMQAQGARLMAPGKWNSGLRDTYIERASA